MSRAAPFEPPDERPRTLADWAALDEDEPAELVDGRFEAEEVPDYLHEVVVLVFGALCRSRFAGRRGFVAGSDAKFAVTPRRGRKPDLTVYLPGGCRKPG